MGCISLFAVMEKAINLQKLTISNCNKLKNDISETDRSNLTALSGRITVDAFEAIKMRPAYVATMLPIRRIIKNIPTFKELLHSLQSYNCLEKHNINYREWNDAITDLSNDVYEFRIDLMRRMHNG